MEVRWFGLADWLESEIPAAEAAGEVAGFLARQFLGFLEARNMNLAQVGKYMPEGTRALSNLMNMLFEAASACKVSVKKAHGWDYLGIHLDGQKYRTSVSFANPEKLWFGTRCRVDPEKAAKLGVGELEEVKPGYHIWWSGTDLESEDAHFFLRSKVGQMEWLMRFLRQNMETARSIEIPNQPPLPEEPEGT